MLLGKRTRREKSRRASIRQNDHSSGFTIVSALFSLTIILLLIPFLSIVLQFARGFSHEHAIDAYHFFIFLRDDIIEASDVEVNKNSLTLTLITGNKATYSLYGNVIRRRIQDQGHEIYIRNIQQLTFTESGDRIRVALITEKGEQYEQELQRYE